MDSLFCQSDQEWHHEHAEEAENEDAKNGEEVSEEICFVGDDGVGDGVAVWTLHLLRPEKNTNKKSKLVMKITYFSSKSICYYSSSLGANIKAAGLISARDITGADSRSA